MAEVNPVGCKVRPNEQRSYGLAMQDYYSIIGANTITDLFVV